MIVEPANESTIEGLVALVNGAYRGVSAERGWAHEAGLLAGQRTDAAALRSALDAGATILTLRDAPSDPLAGCVSVEPKGTDGTWYLGMLTIDPGRQADGLGRLLLEAGEAYARERGGTRIEITVIQLRDTLIAWYERRGYCRTGATAPFPYGDDRFGQPLRPDLHFVVLDKQV